MRLFCFFAILPLSQITIITAARSEGDTGVGIRITVSEVSSISLWLGVGRSLAVSYGG